MYAWCYTFYAYIFELINEWLVSNDTIFILANIVVFQYRTYNLIPDEKCVESKTVLIKIRFTKTV